MRKRRRSRSVQPSSPVGFRYPGEDQFTEVFMNDAIPGFAATMAEKRAGVAVYLPEFRRIADEKGIRYKIDIIANMLQINRSDLDSVDDDTRTRVGEILRMFEERTGFKIVYS